MLIRDSPASSRTDYKQRRWLGPDPEGARVAKETGLCRFCGSDVPSGRRTICSDVCAHELQLRARGGYVRRCLLRRDRGLCAICGVDAARAARAAASAARAIGKGKGSAALLAAAHGALARVPAWAVLAPHLRLSPHRGRPMAGSLWQADHIRAVSKGGGLCGLENLRTLCSPCHAGVTAQQARERAVALRAKRSAAADVLSGAKTSQDDCSLISDEEPLSVIFDSQDSAMSSDGHTSVRHQVQESPRKQSRRWRLGKLHTSSPSALGAEEHVVADESSSPISKRVQNDHSSVGKVWSFGGRTLNRSVSEPVDLDG